MPPGPRRTRTLPGRAVLIAILGMTAPFGLPASVPAAAQAPRQQWKRVELAAANLRLSVPSRWQTRTGTRKDRAFIEAVSPETSMYVVVYSFRDQRATLDDVLDQALAELDIELDEDPEEESINGLDALVGESSGTVKGRDVGMFVLAAASGDTKYVGYVMTDLVEFDVNADVMNRILDSVAPLEARDANGKG